MNHMQEKFQITIPASPSSDDPGPWKSFESARDSQACVPSFTPQTSADSDGNKFNELPPGMEIDEQCCAEINSMPFSMAGETDVSKDTNDGAFDKGFTKRSMKGTDDQYTGEHVDHFYGDTGGFVERNNYLDRE